MNRGKHDGSYTKLTARNFKRHESEAVSSMKKIIKMREMKDNQHGIIRKVTAQGDMGRRIREMGLVPEMEIQVLGRAPLRDPVAIKIKDFTLTLRNKEADNILVEVEGSA